MRRLPTYAEIAEQIGIKWCVLMGVPHPPPSDVELDHWKGGVGRGVVHFYGRQATRAGIHRFLILAYRATAIPGQEPWFDIWRENVYAYETAFHRLGVRLPATLADEARSQVRWQLSGKRRNQQANQAWRWSYGS